MRAACARAWGSIKSNEEGNDQLNREANGEVLSWETILATSTALIRKLSMHLWAWLNPGWSSQKSDSLARTRRIKWWRQYRRRRPVPPSENLHASSTLRAQLWVNVAVSLVEKLIVGKTVSKAKGKGVVEDHNTNVLQQSVEPGDVLQRPRLHRDWMATSRRRPSNLPPTRPCRRRRTTT